MGNLLGGPDVSGPINRQARQTEKKGAKAIKKATKAAKNLEPTGLSAGGLTSSIGRNGSLSITSSPERAGMVSSLADRFNEQAGLTAELRARVAPGVSDLRSSRLQQIENARRASISNLRDNLARRRVLGSSFAEDAISRAEIGFAQEKERVEAETFLQEIDLTNKFLQEEFDLKRSAITTGINELNLQADLGAKLSSEANDVLATSAQLQGQLALGDASFRSNILATQASGITSQAQLDAQAQAGAGALIGKVGGTALGAVVGGPVGAQIGGSIGSSAGAALAS